MIQEELDRVTTEMAIGIANSIAEVQWDSAEPPGWEFDNVTFHLAEFFARTLPAFDKPAFKKICHQHSTSKEEYEEKMAGWD